MASATFNVSKKIKTFRRTIELAIPPQNPEVTGSIKVDYNAMSADEVQKMADDGLEGEEFIRRIVNEVHGLGNDEEAFTGERAMQELLNGDYAIWLRPAVIQEFNDTYGQARRGNSRGRR